MFAKNSIIEWLDATGKPNQERVLHIDAASGQVVLINLTKADSLPRWMEVALLNEEIQKGNSRILSHDPWAAKRGLSEEDIPAKHKTRRDMNWEAIKTIVADPATAFSQEKRFQLIKKSPTPRNQIYSFLRKFWRGGQTKNALLPDYKGREKNTAVKNVGRKAKVQITPNIEHRFESGYQRFVASEEKNTLKRAYELTVQHFFENADEDLPNFRQFEYWVKTRKDPKKTVRQRLGGTEFSLTKRPLLGTANNVVSGPGAAFQIDSTTADIHLVSTTDRSVHVGRPTLFLVTDVFSRLITGFSLALEGAKYTLSSLAILNCVEDKATYCYANGVEIHPEEWPCHHLPECLTADRGELEGAIANVIVEGLNIRLDNTPPFRADMKGVIESKFQSANLGMIHWLPGKTVGLKKRSERDPKEDATLNVKEFTQLIIFWILQHNRSTIHGYPLDPDMIRDKVQPIPNKLWEWGIKHRSGELRTEDPNVVRAQLLPRKEASITRRGIQINGLHFTCPTAEDENWFFRAGEQGAWKTKLAIDPRNCSNTYIQHRDGQLEACALTSRSQIYGGMPWEEVVELRQLSKKLETESKAGDLRKKIDFQKNVDDIVAKAKSEVTKKTPAKRSTISEARRRELEELAKKTVPTPKIIPMPTPPKEEYIGEPSDLDELRDTRE